MDDFCAARTGEIPALLWPNFAPPYTLGNQKIVFKQAAPSRLYWAGHPGMYLVQALHWLHDVMLSDEEQAAVQSAVRRLLTNHATDPALLDDLKSGFAAMPIWMQDILRGHLFGAAAGDRG